jgi:hypothetical protein
VSAVAVVLAATVNGAAGPPPTALAIDKIDFVRNYQGNFGSIKVAGCGFFNDTVFDPVSLLVAWTSNRPCFEKAMRAHGARGDNRVVVDPRADYHGGQGGGPVDLWHDPGTFAKFLSDIHGYRNNRGEPFKVLVFLAADGHIGTCLSGGPEGSPDREAERHFERDLRALAAAAADRIDATAVCWECRNQRNYMAAGTYERNAKLIAELFPWAWHGHHLTSNNSSWTSADGGPERDDSTDGSGPVAWRRCLHEGWCDGLLFQFESGAQYLKPADYPNYTGHAGALGRYWEVIVRLGNDPQSIRTAGGDHHGWPQADVLAFEFIFDAYNDRSDEAYAIDWCRRALAIGGWGCGSASWRRPR